MIEQICSHVWAMLTTTDRQWTRCSKSRTLTAINVASTTEFETETYRIIIVQTQKKASNNVSSARKDYPKLLLVSLRNYPALGLAEATLHISSFYLHLLKF